MRVEQFLERSRERFPNKGALVCGSERLTYAELDCRANRLAHALRGAGVRHGDRVVVFFDNSAEAAVAIFAALKADAVFSPVNPTTKSDKLAYVLNNCRASAVISQDRLRDVVESAVVQSPSVKSVFFAGTDRNAFRPAQHSFEAALESELATRPEGAGIDIDLAMLIYTSGSTGFPKGVMMTHANIVTAATSITTYLRNTAEDIILSALPLSFDYGLYQLLMSTLLGATLILEKSFTFPFAVLEKMKAERVTGFPLVPTMAAILLQMKELQPDFLPDLRYITNTAAALPPAHIQRLQQLFPGAAVFSMYGLTECKRCTYLEPDQLRVRPGSVGKAIPNTEAWVVNDRGELAHPGEVGELVIRGSHVMQGYWEDPESTSRRLKPGKYPWEKVLYTGDLFRCDEEGYLYFVGRSDDIIKSRGEKVSPKEIENVLYALPGVREAAVIGVPDPILGMAIKAVVVPVEENCLSDRDVLTHCQQSLESFMVPKFVEFRAELPKTSTGKIRRSEVQAEALNGS
jgi:amino acid adenylation domain-containing protein